MDVSNIISSLNDAQREAVTSDSPHLLVLAGAGSGKTRVLVHRIAWMIDVQKFPPYAILAVTFTNKAAAEMRHRIEDLLGTKLGNMWVGTFHGLSHRILRLHWQEAELKQNFQILDSDDQLRLIKRVMKDLELDTEKWPPKAAQWYINNKKDEGIRPNNIDPFNDYREQTHKQIYETYQVLCERNGLVDFGELLLRTHELFLKNERVRKHYQSRFKHILVDEFQDTNSIQYAWIRLLAQSTPITIVGDDDQSIYGWRGAKVENIRDFENHFKDTAIVRLEQNYRSTDTILKAANKVIAENSDRLGKNLWTNSQIGEPISLYAAFNELEEARYVVESIEDMLKDYNRSEIAILYRSNAQSRALEEALVRVGVPYRIYGGLRYFDRAEIKNAIAYLRLMESASDDTALERVINFPPRGIGDKTVETIRLYARERGLSLLDAALEACQQKILKARAANAVLTFVKLLEELKKETEELPLGEQTDHMLHKSGLLEHYENEKGERGQARVENLKELISAVKLFDQDRPSSEESALSQFIDHAALESGEEQSGDQDDAVQLMTLHSAKGLEFPVVFMTGLEEGLFPHQRSLDDIDGLSEERRLCYVGITRAMNKLYLSYAESRRVFGKETLNRVSRFVRDIPSDCIEEVRMHHQVSRPTTYQSGDAYSDGFFKDDWQVNESPYQLGQLVNHSMFGIGTVLACEGTGSNARVQVNFEQEGSKWLMIQYAKLETVN